MTSASCALQWGQAGIALPPSGGGSGRGAEACSALSRGGGRRVLLLLQPSEHAEGVLVDRSLGAAPAERVPDVPVDRDLRALCNSCVSPSGGPKNSSASCHALTSGALSMPDRSQLRPCRKW